MRVWPGIERALSTHGTCVLVSVVKTEGSTPREVGARMIVTPEGFHGTIGGGTLEWKALATAQAMLGKPASVKTMAQLLGPDLGQCCGGRVTIAFEAFDGSGRDAVRALAARENDGAFEITNRIPGVPLTEQFSECRRRIIIFGAGHVGRALMLALAPLPFDVMLVDPRPEQLPRAVPANVTLSASDPVSAAAAAPEGSFAFIMSHSHTLDLAITDAALRNLNVVRVGLIGSATKRARFDRRLRDAGVDADRIAGLVSPIGLRGIRSKLPAAIAASVAAQIVMFDEQLKSVTEQPRNFNNAAAG